MLCGWHADVNGWAGRGFTSPSCLLQGSAACKYLLSAKLQWPLPVPPAELGSGSGSLLPKQQDEQGLRYR